MSVVDKLPDEILEYIFILGSKRRRVPLIDDPSVEDPHQSLVPPDAQLDKLKPKPNLDVEDDDGDPDYETDSDDSDDSDFAAPFEFQLAVSHVSQHWRRVVTSIPSLWAVLAFATPPPYSHEQLWLSRAQDYPLTIEIDADAIEEQVKLTVPDQHILDKRSSDEQYLPFDEKVAKRTLDALANILHIVLPHVARWRVFSFTASVGAYVHLLLKTLASEKCGPAPLLEAFNIFDYRDIDDDEDPDADDADLNALVATLSHPLFDGHAPALRRTALWGVPIPWNTNTHLLSGPNLRSLMLAYHLPASAPAARPTYALFTSLLAASPNLVSLSLASSGPLPPFVTRDAWGNDNVWPDLDDDLSPDSAGAIPLPSVRILSLAFHPLEYALALAHRLYVPNLRELSLDYDDGDYSPLVLALCRPRPGYESRLKLSLSSANTNSTLDIHALPAPVHAPLLHALHAAPTSMLLNLARLRLRGLACTPDAIALLWKSVPALEELYVNFYFGFDGDEDDGILGGGGGMLRALGSAGSNATATAEGQGGNAERVRYCPLLRTLIVTGASGKSVRDLVAARHRLLPPSSSSASPGPLAPGPGVGLRQLLVAADDDLSDEDRTWLAANVEVFGVFENSDDEDDDDDDDDEEYEDEYDEDEDDDDDEEDDDDEDDGDDDAYGNQQYAIDAMHALNEVMHAAAELGRRERERDRLRARAQEMAANNARTRNDSADIDELDLIGRRGASAGGSSRAGRGRGGGAYIEEVEVEEDDDDDEWEDVDDVEDVD